MNTVICQINVNAEFLSILYVFCSSLNKLSKLFYPPYQSNEKIKLQSREVKLDWINFENFHSSEFTRPIQWKISHQYNTANIELFDISLLPHFCRKIPDIRILLLKSKLEKFTTIDFDSNVLHSIDISFILWYFTRITFVIFVETSFF